jgi:lysophospholipase L1-like esterase
LETTRRRRLHWILLLLSPWLVLVGLEVLLRLLVFPGGIPEPPVGNLDTPRYDQNFGPGRGDLAPGQNAVWTVWPHRPYHVQTNSDGLRNAHEVDEKALRILAVGDSFTFGPYVPNEDTWPGWLENLLRQHPASTRVQVLNAGHSGYTIQDEYFYLAERGVRVAPHLVILAFYPNDLTDFSGTQRTFLSRLPQMGPTGALWNRFTQIARPLTRRSALAQALLRGWRRMRVREAAADLGKAVPLDATADRSSPQAAHDGRTPYREWFDRTVDLLQAQRIPLLVVAIPTLGQVAAPEPDTAAQRFLEEIARARRVAYLDTLPFLRSRGDAEDFYLVQLDSQPSTERRYVGNGHMTSHGYKNVAACIAQHLIGEGRLFAGGQQAGPALQSR